MLQVIQTLQGIDDLRMKNILQAVISQNAEVIGQLASALKTDSKQIEFLVIAECANRWLRAQD